MTQWFRRWLWLVCAAGALTGCPHGVPAGGNFSPADAKAAADVGGVAGPDAAADAAPGDVPVTADAANAELPVVQTDVVTADAKTGFDACGCASDSNCSGVALGTCQVAKCGAGCKCTVGVAPDGSACGGGFVCQSGKCLAAPTPGPWAKSVAAGGSHSCALHPGGTVSCWGSSWQGQLGNGSTDVDSPVPVPVGVLGPVTQLVAGSTHSCALHSGGKVSCWGDRFNGQTGSGSNSGYATVPELAGTMADVLSIAAGTNSSFAVRNGATAWGWGNGNGGQLLQDTLASQSDPVQLASMLDVKSVCGGDHHACALHDNGTVECWGRNTDGQVGHGTTGQNEIVKAGLVDGVSGIANIACGHVNTCAWDDAGTVWCWGSNISGQLLTGNYGTSPVNAPLQLQGLVSVSALAAGQTHACALGKSGDIACWGDNAHGQCGGSSGGDAYKPITISLGGKATAVSAGTQHTCAVREDGAVLCWGSNSSGQLGNAGKDDSATPVLVVGSAGK